VCSGPLRTHKSYGGVGRRRVVPELTGEVNISVSGGHHRWRRVFVANLQGTSCRQASSSCCTRGPDGSCEPSRDQEQRRNATTSSRQRRQEAIMGAGRDGTGAQSSFRFGERVSETDTRKERPLEGGSRSRGGRLDGEVPACTALQGAAQGHGL
jgi:hypothetical protein